MDTRKFMLQKGNLKELPFQNLLNQRVKAKYCKNGHSPKIKNGFEKAFCQNLKKKNLLTLNCLSVGLLFLLANKGKNLWIKSLILRYSEFQIQKAHRFLHSLGNLNKINDGKRISHI